MKKIPTGNHEVWDDNVITTYVTCTYVIRIEYMFFKSRTNNKLEEKSDLRIKTVIRYASYDM